MSIRIRATGENDDAAFERAVATAFGRAITDADVDRYRNVSDASRDLGAYDGATIVGTATSVEYRLSIPGGELPCAGVTGVGVAPSHRRRGILTALMRRQLDDLHERGEALAALWASEGAIYGRFGYGLATVNARIDADRAGVGLDLGGDSVGAVRLIDEAETLRLLPRVYDRVRSGTPGFPSRTKAWWKNIVLHDAESERRGAGPLFRAVLELGGRAEGYALYRMEHQWSEGFPSGTLRIQEELATGPLATRELWRFLFGVDLVDRIRTRSMPPDHPLFLLVSELPRLRFRLADGLFLRLIDARAALAARSYAGEGALVLELADAFCPWNARRWQLEAGPGGVSVRAARRRADLRLEARELAAAYLGGFSFARLARAGRIEELRRGAAACGDALFRVDAAPWCPGFF